MLGLCQRSQNNLSAALGNLRKAVELDAAGEKPDPRYSIALAQALNQAKQYNYAYTTLKAFDFGSLPASYRTSYALLFANAANETNRSGEAVNMLKSQTRADSSNAALFQALGVAQDDLGYDNDAYAAFKKAYELNPSDQATGRSAVHSGILAARRSTSSRSRQGAGTASGIRSRMKSRGAYPIAACTSSWSKYTLRIGARTTRVRVRTSMKRL